MRASCGHWNFDYGCQTRENVPKFEIGQMRHIYKKWPWNFHMILNLNLLTLCFSYLIKWVLSYQACWLVTIPSNRPLLVAPSILARLGPLSLSPQESTWAGHCEHINKLNCIWQGVSWSDDLSATEYIKNCFFGHQFKSLSFLYPILILTMWIDAKNPSFDHKLNNLLFFIIWV